MPICLSPISLIHSLMQCLELMINLINQSHSEYQMFFSSGLQDVLIVADEDFDSDRPCRSDQRPLTALTPSLSAQHLDSYRPRTCLLFSD